MFKTPFLICVFILIFIFSPANGDTGSERVTKIKIDFTERFRFVSWDNPVTLDSSSEEGSAFTRNRTSLGLLWKPFSGLDIYFKATNEFRYYFKPEGRDFNINEIFVDNFYLKLKNICDLPLTITAGRQNLFFGEGFIIVDGGPLDGSRSIWFDAVRGDISLGNSGRLTAFYLSAPKEDDLFPVLNDRGQLLNENSSTGAGFYYSGKWKKKDMDLYLVKKSYGENVIEKRNYTVAGARMVLPMSDDMAVVGEAAYQWGNSGDIPVSAAGGYFYFRYIPISGISVLKGLTFGSLYLSGDDPFTDKIEGWDPVFSRWPKWSESFIYTLVMEGGAAYWSNLSSFFFTLDLNPVKNGVLSTALYFLTAPERGCSCLDYRGNGIARGFLFTGRFDYRFSSVLSGHVVFEHFDPGNFYFEKAESYNWFRIELMYKIK